MLLRRIYPTLAAILPVQKRQLTIINTLKHFFIMQRDKSLMERRNKAIYARFNELIKTGQHFSITVNRDVSNGSNLPNRILAYVNLF